MLIKLLATKIVANSFLGRSNRRAIIAIDLELLSKPSLIFVFVKENRATSAPDIKAEQQSNNTSTAILSIKDVFVIKKRTNKRGGSGSKINCFQCMLKR